MAEDLPQSYAELRLELADREIDEDDFIALLEEKGINLRLVNLQDPRQYAELRPILQESLSELSADQTSPLQIDSLPGEYIRSPQDSSRDQKPTQSSVPDSLSIHGHDLFTDKLRIVESPTELQPAQDYILGRGDKLVISIWGASTLQKSVEIDATGFINLDSPPLRVALAGLTLSAAKDVLRNQLLNYYRFDRDQMMVYVSSARSIRVTVIGQVRSPGSYTLPATNSAINFIAKAGGPEDAGNLRRIQIVTDGKTSYLDVYDFMNDPSIQADLYLEDNAIIKVPTYDRRVYFSGAVHRPGFYDLKSGETIEDLIAIAGGLKPNAYRKQIQVLRRVDSRQVMMDLRLDSLQQKRAILQDGDEVFIPSIPREAENYVLVKGAVFKPGRYAFEEGMTLKNLINQAGLVEQTRRDLAYIARRTVAGNRRYKRISLVDIMNSDSGKIELEKGDEIIILSAESYADPGYFYVYGAVRDTGTFDYDQKGSLRLTDAMELSGGLTKEASGLIFIKRKREDTPGGNKFIRVNLNDIEQGDTSQNIVVSNRDTIYVENALEFYNGAFVEIYGEINKPGRFDYSPELKLRDLIYLAAGYTPKAERNRIDIYRIKNTGSSQESYAERVTYDPMTADEDPFILQPYDRVIVRNISNFQYQKIINISGEVYYPGPYALLDDNHQLVDVVRQAGGLTPEAFPEGATLYRKKDSLGYIVMKLEDAIKNSKSPYNYLLQAGDEINIPARKEFIEISGAINASSIYPDKFVNPGNSVKVPYDGERSAKYYINQYAAGVSDLADKDLITVEQPNGQLQGTKRFLFIRSYPKVRKGSKIKVGYKRPEKEKKKEKEPVDWGRLVGQTIAQATAVLSLILLVRELRQE